MSDHVKAPIASTDDQLENNKKIKELIDMSSLQITVSAQNQAKTITREAFEADKDSMNKKIYSFESKFRDAFDKKLKDHTAKLMHASGSKLIKPHAPSTMK